MREDFPYVEIPEDVWPILGNPELGTRKYVRSGPEEEAGPWFDKMTEIAGPCVSPGGAAMFVPSSRASVYKRIAEGKLTAFFFEVTSMRRGLFGKRRKLRETAYGYIPVSELKAWEKDLLERIEKNTKSES